MDAASFLRVAVGGISLLIVGCGGPTQASMQVPKQPLGNVADFYWRLGERFESPAAVQKEIELRWRADFREQPAPSEVPPFGQVLPLPPVVGIVYFGIRPSDEDSQEMFATLRAPDPGGFTVESLLWSINEATWQETEEMDSIFVGGIHRTDGTEYSAHDPMPPAARLALEAGIPVFVVRCDS